MSNPVASGKSRLALVCHRYQLKREYASMFEALERRFDLTKVFVDDGWPRTIAALPDYQTYQACLWFVRFRELIVQTPFDWADFHGVRVMYDWDSYQNVNLLGGSTFLGKWPEVFRRNEFHLLICTGLSAQDNLREQGVNAHWVPKAADQSRFFPMNLPRAGFCYFGEPYRSRAAMLHYVARHGVKVSQFKCAYADLNAALNRYWGCLVCNQVGHTDGWLASTLNKLIPSRFITHTVGPETMGKNFEVAAAGCVAFCDSIPEFPSLGFLDGETVVTYESFDDLVEKLKYYSTREDMLRDIGERAATLSRERHTWDHRAAAFAELIATYR